MVYDKQGYNSSWQMINGMKNILILISLFIYGIAGAQSFYNNGSSVTIGSNTIFSVSDSLVNNGTLTNNGNMVIGGVWLNLGTYNPGVGEITFNSPSGSDAQIINHNSQSVNKLTISGGGEKIILANMTIEGELVLTDGIITQQNDASVIFAPNAQISGGSDQAHIHGTVYQQGTGDKLFPIGNGTTYLPVEILGITEEAEVGVTLVEFPTPQSFDFKRELAAVSNKRYWEVDLVSGELAGSQISLPVKDDEGLSASSTQYVVVQSLASPIEFESLGQSSFGGTITNGSVVSSAAVSAGLVSVGVLSEGIIIYNAISANNDARNAILKISNITSYPNNKVTIINRWGDIVFEVRGYDNDQKVFRGISNKGSNNELPAGNYFYVIDKGDGSDLLNGYISLKR